jgi:ParB family chromosome partitioning protein
MALLQVPTRKEVNQVSEDQMQIRQIDPKLIRIPDVRIDASYEQDQLAMLDDDIRKKGIEQPLDVALKDGEMWVVDGRHRLESALKLGFPSVPCVIREMSIEDLQMRNLVTSVLKGKTKISEEIKMVGDLYNNHHITIDDIVNRSGLRRDRIETEILIASAHPEILQEIDQGRIKLCHAKELVRLPEHSQQYTMLQIVLQYRSKCDVVCELVNEALRTIEFNKNPKVAPVQVGPPPVPMGVCSCCNEEYPLQMLTSPIICRGCYATLIQAFQEGVRLAREEAKRQSIRDAVRSGAEDIVGGGS